MHLGLQRQAGWVVMSDHLLLAACVLACLQAEATAAISDAYKCELGHGSTLRLMALISLFLAGVILYFALCADMYFTASLFHTLPHSAAALALGLLLFQAPAALLLSRAADAAGAACSGQKR